MRHTLLLLFIAISSLTAHAQDALNMTLLGHLPYTQNLSDVRGALHNGREYALVGVYNGLSIVDVSNPAAPFQVFFEPGGNSIWRDPFYYNGYAYCVNETSGGLLIVDMAPLPAPGPPPAVTNLPVVNYTGSQFPFTSAHNMSIDEQGHAYIYGANYGVGGTIILDISQNPTAPTELGVWNQYYVHDGFVRGDTLWAACVNAGIAAVVNISNPAQPQVMATWSTPSNFTHNIWPSDDNRTVYTTDEVGSGFVTAYDVTDLSNVVELDRVNHPLSAGVIPHNAHFFNDYVVTSHYRDGVTVHDASDPSNVILTGYYDSSPMEGIGFNGSWGAWPYLPSGIVLNADIEGGLYVLQCNYTRAARLQGTVTNNSTSVPLSGVAIEIVGTPVQESTAIFGTYATGLAQGGTFDVTFIKGGFLPQTITDVVLTNGQTTILDVQLVPDIPFTLQVNVIETPSGDPVEGATITFVNNLFDISGTTDVNGVLLDENFFDGTYEVTVGRWGNRTACGTFTLNADNNIIEFELPKQYYDDFALDFGWEVTGPATSGIWVRDAPIGTFYEGNMANPDSHSGEGCGNLAYVTGNAGPPVNIDDVDDGATILTSPVMDLSQFSQPNLSFRYWYYTGGGSSPSNDEMLVRVLNGTELVTIESLSTTAGQWGEADFSIFVFIPASNQIRIQFFIQDAPPGHLVEGGIDFFEVQDVGSTSEITSANQISLFPNPTSSGTFQLAIARPYVKGTVRVMDMTGKLVMAERPISRNVTTLDAPATSGIYLVETIVDGNRAVQKLAVHP